MQEAGYSVTEVAGVLTGVYNFDTHQVAAAFKVAKHAKHEVAKGVKHAKHKVGKGVKAVKKVLKSFLHF